MTALVLASGSAIRSDLLRRVGIAFDQRAADIDERGLENQLIGVSPDILAETLAIEKAKVVSANHHGALIIGADQVLSFNGDVLHKAKTHGEAAQKLARLQGAMHALISAAALVQDGNVLWSCTDTAHLTMRALNEPAISAYLNRAGYAATQSVGAYRLEDVGAALFERIEGDYFTILGLPLLPLLAALRVQGIDPIRGEVE